MARFLSSSEVRIQNYINLELPTLPNSNLRTTHDAGGFVSLLHSVCYNAKVIQTYLLLEGKSVRTADTQGTGET